MISPNSHLICAQPQAHKSEDNVKPSVSIEDALVITLIADEILQHLSPPEILQCSLVSRCWRDACREHLRRIKVYVVVTNPACSSLQALNELLADSVNLPFAGLYFEDSTPINSTKNPCRRCKRYRNMRADAVYPFIFRKLELKVLKIDYFDKRTCIADKFLKSIFKNKAARIEEMRISGWSDSLPSLCNYISVPGTSKPTLLPSLKVCGLNRMPEDSRTRAVLIREIVLSSPNLSYLDAIVPVSMFSEDENSSELQFPKNRFRVLKSFHCVDTHSVDRLVKEKPRLEYLALWPSLIEQDEEMIDSIREGVATICDSSSDSLKVLECRYNMIMLKFLPLKRLVNLTALDLTFSLATYDYYKVNYLLLRSIDLRPIFPSLREVTWRFDRKPRAGYFRDCQTLLQELRSNLELSSIWPSSYGSSVTTILLIFEEQEYRWYAQRYLKWQAIKNTFPDVRTFYVKEAADFWRFWHGIGKVNRWLWEETLETVGYYYNIPTKDFPKALVYIFCGIEPEELKAICDDMDENALKDWQFAPSGAAPIAKFLRLPKIELFFEHKMDEVCSEENVPHPQEDWERMFGLAMRWIRAKIPALVLQIVAVNPCSKNCDPFRLNYPRNYMEVTKSKQVTTSGSRLCWTFKT